MNENFENALNVDCSGFVEKKKTGRKIEKNGRWVEEELSYLSWAVAWEKFKKIYPDAMYRIKTFENKPFMYDENTGYMVFTEVAAEGVKYEMWLPVMNSNNKAMKSAPYEYKTNKGVKTVEAATMFDINTAIMRCLTKNLAMFGLGLKIYQGEDIPRNEPEAVQEKNSIDEINAELDKQLAEEDNELRCRECGDVISPSVHTYSLEHYNKPLCMKCQRKVKN